jgi:hypothetical protein
MQRSLMIIAILLVAMSLGFMKVQAQEECWISPDGGLDNTVYCHTPESLATALGYTTPEAVSEMLFDANPDPILAEKRELIWECGYQAALNPNMTEEIAMASAAQCYTDFAGPQVPPEDEDIEIPAACNDIIWEIHEDYVFMYWGELEQPIIYYYLPPLGWLHDMPFEDWVTGVYQGLDHGHGIKYIFPQCGGLTFEYHMP